MTDYNQTDDMLDQLEALIQERYEQMPEGAYTTSLFSDGVKRIAQKVGEEGVEVALAAVAGDMDELKNESADLIYHLLVLLRANNLSLEDIKEVLRGRHAQC